MCGISGILSLSSGQGANPGLLKSMTDLIRHRGPDDEGFLFASSGGMQSFSGKESTEEVKGLYPDVETAQPSSLAMGFRRLSVLDLSVCGHQPLEDSGLAITFNGEIYNYLELMQELSSAGYSFRGHSDSEVILKAYRHWGEACVEHFVGMWAFAIWDGGQQKLFLSRDRFGIKPLYYCRTRDFLFWGSEIKQLLLYPIDKSLNYAMIWRSMKINSLLVHEDETYFKEIKLLKPGHNLVISSGEFRFSQYYSLDASSFEKSPLSLQQATDHYRELFTQSLKLHLRSDVEIAASLSGGLDSSAIVCLAHKLQGGSMQTFSSYYGDDPALDERKWIKLIAEQTEARTHFVSPSAADASGWLEEINWYNDLPTKAGYASQWAVMKTARAAGIKVILSGQGSDELFAGYKHSIYRFLADQLRNLKLTSFTQSFSRYYQGKGSAESLAGLGKTLLSAVLPESKLYELEFRYYRFEPFSASFLETRKLSSKGILSGIQDIPGSRLSNFLFNMLHSTSIQTLLHLEDRMASANSIESRVPFLDHRIVDFAFSLPAAYKIEAPVHKHIHRLAMKDIVPQAVYERKDKGIFSSPFYTLWMRGEMREMISDVFASQDFLSREIWNHRLIRRHWFEYLSGSNKQAEMLFNCLALELWFRRFKDYL